MYTISDPRPKNKSDDLYAVCKYTINYHFPHAMQQLYSCWSYWQTRPEKHFVLKVFEKEHHGIVEKIRNIIYRRRNRNNPFVPGFLEALTIVFGVEIVDQYNERFRNVPFVQHKSSYNGYRLLQNHTSILRDGFVKHFGQESPPPFCLNSPRIAILNRKSNRSLLNAVQLQLALQRALRVDKVDIHYMEGTNFADQVMFWSSYDIVVSPHGAQLTGLAFLPTCAGILEVFPADYLMPVFFGSLAKAAGVSHAFVYLGSAEETVDEVMERMNDKHFRARAREVNLCPAIDPMVEAVRDLVTQWMACCNMTI